MKSREAIRNKIINYARIVWNTKRVDDIHPLIHLMIEDVCNELYLMDNKLHDIDTTILEKLVRSLVPTKFNYVRAASAITRIRPAQHKFYLSRKTEFYIKEMPDYLLRKNLETVAFSPVTDIQLHNLAISHLFYNRKLWQTDNLGNRKLIGQTARHCVGNKLCLLLDNPAGLKLVKDLPFYIEFPHLKDNHDYYQVLSLAKWKAGDTFFQMEEGLPLISKVIPNKFEAEVLSYHKIHYRRIKGELRLDDKSCQTLPDDLASIPETELIESLPQGYWICIEFPANFMAKDIEKIQILLNAFPVLNRRYVNMRQETSAFTGTVALASEPGEEYLNLECIEDQNSRGYELCDTGHELKQGVYSLEPVKKKNIYDTRLHDYLELFADVLERERTVFPKIDKDKIVEIQHAVAALLKNDSKKVDSNILNEYAEVARLSVNPRENTHTLTMDYWTTLGETINDLPAYTQLMASQVTALNKSDTTLISPVSGGRSFYDMDSIKAINRFYMTSKGRILTKHDILSFCRIEVGQYINDIDAVRCGKISSKPGEGIVNAMEIRITPKENHRDYFKRKDVLRWLKMRLEELSPIHYNYVITVVE